MSETLCFISFDLARFCSPRPTTKGTNRSHTTDKRCSTWTG